MNKINEMRREISFKSLKFSLPDKGKILKPVDLHVGLSVIEVIVNYLQQLCLIVPFDVFFHSRYRRINSLWRGALFPEHLVPVNSLEKIVVLNLVDSLASHSLFWVLSQKALQQASTPFRYNFRKLNFSVGDIVIKLFNILWVERRLTH